MLCTYKLNNAEEEEEKEQFYSILSQTVERYKEKDLVIAMGDFNAKIGKDTTPGMNELWEDTDWVRRTKMGRYLLTSVQTSNVSWGALCSPTKKHTR